MGQATALALAGRIDEARLARARALELEPGLSIRSLFELGYPKAIADKFVQVYRMLDVPEG